MFSIGDNVQITVNKKNVIAGYLGVVGGITELPTYPEGVLRKHYLVQGEGFEEGILFTEEELELRGSPVEIEVKQPLTVEEVRNLKREAENKIDDILETLSKGLGLMADIEGVNFKQQIPLGKKCFRTKIDVFIS